MTDIVISGTGPLTPHQSVNSQRRAGEHSTAYVTAFNDEHAADIAASDIEPLQPSSADFIEKASGIKSRYVIDKKRILDPND